eukprot:CAMPEP_0175900410 /NCGR_PEP_ID=MMETSP0108-20121206/2320_1 /TAXON_ID=195067 ORGANISM="Goniomonas pacifica, Strain CCMP1869" /NCGR_SAMPLE_ID=MMETSP0108 /ASSEMBLY_ACC=CAM_ASM_000204 /LENGTH=60 /DNA_ID=CAMNT_0017221937 /DNA_START=223 /DNA_END=406 /DNA_ORIENTATION=-
MHTGVHNEAAVLGKLGNGFCERDQQRWEREGQTMPGRDETPVDRVGVESVAASGGRSAMG